MVYVPPPSESLYYLHANPHMHINSIIKNFLIILIFLHLPLSPSKWGVPMLLNVKYSSLPITDSNGSCTCVAQAVCWILSHTWCTSLQSSVEAARQFPWPHEPKETGGTSPLVTCCHPGTCCRNKRTPYIHSFSFKTRAQDTKMTIIVHSFYTW